MFDFWKGRHILVLAACLGLISTHAQAEWGYGVFGNLGTGLDYTRESSGDSSTWSFTRTDTYNLGVTGSILDPRLVLFTIAGGLATNDSRASHNSGAADSRLLSFVGNLLLLSGKPYPLELRISQSHFSSDEATDALSFGGSWRVIYGDLPSMALNFDRSTIDGSGDTKTRSAFTTGSLKLAKRISDSDLEAEFGIQNFTDDVRGTSNTAYFGRASDVTQWSPATSARLTADYFIQSDSRSLASILSLINHPDPTLTRSLSLGITNTAGKDQQGTTLNGSGSIFKTYQPYPTLSLTPFSNALALHRFGSGELEDATQLNWSAGSSLVSTYFRPVVASADYGLGISYSRDPDAGASLGMTQQFHLGLESATLQPYRVRGDYLFTLERTLVERTRNQASLRAEGPVMPMVFFRSYAEFFHDDATFSGQSSNQTSLTFGANLSYTGIRQLYFSVGADVARLDNDANLSWVTRILSNLNYTPVPRLSLQLNGARETDTLSALTRYQALAGATYLYGRTTLKLEYRFESRQSLGQPGRSQSIHFTMNRPFQFSF